MIQNLFLNINFIALTNIKTFKDIQIHKLTRTQKHTGMSGMADLYGMSPSTYSQMGALRGTPGHPQSMLLPTHSPYGMMMGAAMPHPSIYPIPGSQSSPHHTGIDVMNHIQDIHAG